MFGVGLVQFDDDRAVQEFTANDPTIQSNRGFRWEVLPMPFGVVYPRPSVPGSDGGLRPAVRSPVSNS